MRIRHALVIALFSGLCQPLRAQCGGYDSTAPDIRKATLTCEVTKEGATDVFTYRYTIINSRLSTGCIKWFELDLACPKNAVKLPTIGLVDYPAYVGRSALVAAGATKIVPVGVPRLPNYKGFTSAWDADFLQEGSILWGDAINEYRVEPGAALDSIILTSHGLPGIRRAIMYPSYDPIPVDTTEEDPVASLTFDSLEATLKWTGVTVGPSAPPAKFDPVAFIDTLMAFVRAARTEGWIKSDRRSEAFLDLFGQTKDIVRSSHTHSALSVLRWILEEVAADEGEPLSSEAFALIRFNTEYLMSQLKAKR